MSSPTVADLLVDRLIAWGVDTIFGLPGDGIDGVFEALRTRSEKIRFIQVRHEEAAAFAACGHAGRGDPRHERARRRAHRGAHHDVSIACGERVLLPAVRNADDRTLIITDGFSCREQIIQTTNRRPVHSADVLKLALDQEAT